MKPGQQRIYYLIAESVVAARSSPYIEQLKEHGVEVLLLAERIDEWVMSQLDEFEGFGDFPLDALIAADRLVQSRALAEELLCRLGIVPQFGVFRLGVQLR